VRFELLDGAGAGAGAGADADIRRQWGVIAVTDHDCTFLALIGGEVAARLLA
jgi:hypothetical protein